MLIKSLVLSLTFVLSTLIAFNAKANSTVITDGIVATIKPIHSLVSAVMAGTGQATLLVANEQSPHGFQLKPSQIRQMHQAKIIFYVDDAYETFLNRSFATLPAKVRKVALARQSGIRVLTTRKGVNWEAHDHEHNHNDDVNGDSDSDEASHHHHDHHGGDDLHVWLAPDNGIKMVKEITRQLSQLYPQNRDIYKANAKNIVAKIEKLDESLQRQLSAIKAKPFIVFHDAYQYFERAYGLRAVGSITFEPTDSPSPQRIKAIRAKLQNTGIKCVFREPQFSDRLVNTIIEGADGVSSGTLDPVGANLANGSGLYIKLLQNLTSGLNQCLARATTGS
jgi:zinc transport system substrate-binding protein